MWIIEIMEFLQFNKGVISFSKWALGLLLVIFVIYGFIECIWKIYKDWRKDEQDRERASNRIIETWAGTKR
jgi:hypothetical protein